MDVAAIGTAVATASGVAAIGLYVIRAEVRGDVTRLDGRINTTEAMQAQLRDDVKYIRERIDHALSERV